MDQFSEVELPGGLVVKAKIDAGTTNKNLSKGDQRVSIQKGVEMSTLDEKIEQFKQNLDAQATAILAAAEAKLAAIRPTPAPVSKSIALSGFSGIELHKKLCAGEITLDQYNGEMDFRRKYPQHHKKVVEAVEKASDQLTASHLASVVKAQYLAARDKAKAELIIKNAMDASIERMSQADFDLMQANLSKAERRELEFQRTNESQFQENLLGSPEAVAGYWQEYIHRPQPTMEAIAKSDLAELVKGTDPVALELQAYFEDQQIKKAQAQRNKKWSFNAVRPATELRAG